MAVESELGGRDRLTKHRREFPETGHGDRGTTGKAGLDFLRASPRRAAPPTRCQNRAFARDTVGPFRMFTPVKPMILKRKHQTQGTVRTAQHVGSRAGRFSRSIILQIAVALSEGPGLLSCVTKQQAYRSNQFGASLGFRQKDVRAGL
jgi:hypothetical protein